MADAAPTTFLAEIPTWATDLSAAIRRGQHVLLHGNVGDQFQVSDGYLDLRATLWAVLAAIGFDAIGGFSLADGFFSRDPESQEFFESAARDLSAEGHSDRLRTDDLADPLTALAFARGVLRRPQRAAVVVDRADLVLVNSNDSDERRVFTLISRAIEDASLTESGSVPLRSALVLVSPTITPALSRLLQSEPLLVAIEVQHPTLDERRTFVRRCITQFHEPPTHEDEDRVVDAMARLTNGFTLWDLEAVRRTSHLDGLTVGDPHQLVMSHVRSRRESPWNHTDARLLAETSTFLRGEIIGQDHVLDRIGPKLCHACFGVGIDRDSARREQRPRLAMFFVGPTGVGKTELCKAIARLIFGDESALIRFDMGEYGDKSSANRLTGADPGYVGFESGGQLVNAVMRQPHAVLLFDEIEKAHPDVLNLFLAILDEGRLTDGHGRTADFRDTIIVFTSNAGAREISAQQRAGVTPPREQILEHFRSAVRNYLSNEVNRPELYGRLERADAVMAFDVIRTDAIGRIAAKLVRQWRNNVLRVYSMRIEMDEQAAVDAALSRLGAGALESGARPVEGAVIKALDVPLALWVAEHDPVPSGVLYLRFDDAGETLIHA